jgi:hypothetical protein|tara:strand:+ start:1243 stop:1581 length:339 start_codon:yes stop_codon:yes gene_type:complete
MAYTHSLDISNHLMVAEKTKVGDEEKNEVVTGVYVTATCTSDKKVETTRSTWVMLDLTTADPDHFIEYSKLTGLPGRATTEVNIWHTSVKEALEKENADAPSKPVFKLASWS